MKHNKILNSSLATVFASVTTTFIVAYAFFKLAGPVPISVTQTTVEKKNTFDVIGEGKVIAVPDIAEVNLGMKAEKGNVAEAQKQANQTINSIEKALKKLKIDKKDIKTTDYRVYPNYDYSRGSRKITGYTVETNLRVKVRDFEKINQLIDKATSLGANQIGQLNFSVEEEKLEEYKNQAREEAVEKAKEKAKNLAQIAGVKIGKIINLQEDYQPPIPPRSIGGIMLEKAEEEEPTQIQPGSTEITVIITLSYEIL